MNREDWLHTVLAQFLRPFFNDQGYHVPEKVRIGVGWPSKQALSEKRKRIGEAWSCECSGDHHHEIIISPYLDNAEKVIEVLIHELVHVVVGVQHKHKKPFSQCAAKVGLVKPWTATSASPELIRQLQTWIKKIEPYPHAALTSMVGRKPDTTRLLLLECQCGLKIRSTQKWIDTYGSVWPCPCGGKLERKAE